MTTLPEKPGGNMARDDEKQKDEEYNPAEKFGWPEGEQGVVYFDEHGREISQEKWLERVKRKARRIKAERGQGAATP